MILTKKIVLFYREKYLFLFFNLAAGCFLASMFWVLFIIGPRPGSMPLHYDIFFGIDRIGSWWQLLASGGAVGGLTLVNALIAYRIFARDKYLAYYMALMSAIASTLFLLYILTLTLYAL